MPTPTQRTGKNTVKVSRELMPESQLRLQRMARELRLTDQILSVDVDSVTITDSGGAPAWTSADGAHVSFNIDMMPGIQSRKNVAVWLGTNSHELFHNLFTPRTNSPLMRRVRAAERSTDPGIHRSWNVLEDQRIERLGIDRFVAWRGYLIAALRYHINVGNDPRSWLLLAGRTWIPAEVRQLSRALFADCYGNVEAEGVARLIGAYQRLADPGDADAAEAWAIVSEFHGLWGDKVPQKSTCGHRPMSEGEPEQVDDATVSMPCADEPEPEPDDDEPLVDTNDDDSDDADNDGDDGGDDTDGDDDGDGSDDGSDGDGDDDDEADGESGSGDSDSDDDGDDDSDESGGHSEESSDSGDPGDGYSEKGTTRTVRAALDDAVDEALKDHDTRDDLDRVVDALDHGTAGALDLPRTGGDWHDVSQRARFLARDVTTVLSDMRDDCEAAWTRRTDSGRFSVDRWATDPDWDADNVFDLFDPGAMDATSLDLVLLLDVSASMQRENFGLAEATWAIRQAVDRIEGRVTCIGFGTDASLMFRADERPDQRLFVPLLENSTNPVPALRQALMVLNDAQATNKLLLILTDGDWYGYGPPTSAIKACEQAGAVTAIAGLRHRITDGFCGAQVVATITDTDSFVAMFRDLAMRSMKAAANC